MYGYVYKTTCISDGSIYIGQHSGSFTENYIGSGKLIKNKIRRFGKNKFIVEMLEKCDTPEELNLRETYWISQYIHDDNCINIIEGQYPPMSTNKAKELSDNYWKSDDSHLIKSRKMKEIWDNSPERKIEMSNRQLGSNNHSSRAIVQLDLDGNFVREYSYIRETEKFGFKEYCVKDCCRGKQKSHKNYRFMYKEDYTGGVDK